MDISELLAFSVKNKASDLHLSAGLPPMIRVHGDVRRINLPPLEHKDVHGMIYDIMNDGQRKQYEEVLECDFSFAIPGLARFRVNAFNQERGAAAVLRTIPSKILSLEDLNAPKIFAELAMRPRTNVAVGIGTGFPMAGSRSIYGATKLASELMIEEYGAMYGLRAVVNRCGVLTGPWQMGKVDQGFMVLWAARHLFGGGLSYMGFGGTGAQVRDILHVADLYDLIRIQVGDLGLHAGRTYNVGGGAGVSVSLAELTDLCVRRCQRVATLGSDPETRAAEQAQLYKATASLRQASTTRPPSRPASVVVRPGMHATMRDARAWSAHDSHVTVPPVSAYRCHPR